MRRPFGICSLRGAGRALGFFLLIEAVRNANGLRAQPAAWPCPGVRADAGRWTLDAGRWTLDVGSGYASCILYDTHMDSPSAAFGIGNKSDIVNGCGRHCGCRYGHVNAWPSGSCYVGFTVWGWSEHLENTQALCRYAEKLVFEQCLGVLG